MSVKNKVTLMCLTAILMICGQSNAQDPNKDYRAMHKYYDQGDYVNATLKAISFLRVRPKKKKAQEVLSVSFNMAMEDLRIEISDLKDNTRSFEGDETVYDRRKIIEKYKLMRKLDRQGREIVRIIPKQKVPLEFDRVSVSSQLEEGQKKLDDAIASATEMHYEEGLMLKQLSGRENQKKAAKAFRRAINYTDGYKDSQRLYNEAKKKATTRVAILPFVNKSGVMTYGEVGEMTSDKLRAGILNNTQAMEFIEIYTRDQLDIVMQEHNLNMTNEIIDQQTIAEFGRALGIHIIITGKVMQVAAEQKQTIHDGARRNTVRVVTGQRTAYNSAGKPYKQNVWGDVWADNYHHHKRAISTINGSYEMIDVESGRVLASDQFRESYEWKNSWSTYKGDQRAATRPTGFHSGEKASPSKTELANKVIDRLGLKVASDVINLIK